MFIFLIIFVLVRKAFEALGENPNIAILGNDTASRLPIFSIIIYHQDSGKLVHHNFVSVLLNDLYGIQARGGCACAGPYAQDLLGLNESMARKFTWFLEKHENESVGGLLKEPLEIMKPGFARVGLPYFMNDKPVDFVLNAVNMVATHGWKLLPQDIAEAAKRVFNEAVDVNKEISTIKEEVIEFTDDRNQLVWFLQPNEAQFYLAAETLKYKPKPFGRNKSPFTPKHGHSPRVSPQISPAGSDPDLHMNGHVDGHVESPSDDSEDVTQKHTLLQAREDWDPKDSHKKVAGGKKKRDVIEKIKRALCHVPRH